MTRPVSESQDLSKRKGFKLEELKKDEILSFQDQHNEYHIVVPNSKRSEIVLTSTRSGFKRPEHYTFQGVTESVLNRSIIPGWFEPGMCFRFISSDNLVTTTTHIKKDFKRVRDPQTARLLVREAMHQRNESISARACEA